MNSLAFPCVGITKPAMPWNFGEKLFPNASPWERRQKMMVIVFTVLGSIVLIAGVALIMVQVSKVHLVQ
jgi:hypothetical protein